MTNVVRALRAWSPWAPGEAIRWVVAGLAGHVVWFAGFWLARYEASFGGQIKWATLAAGGFVLAAYADITWLLRARWAILQRRAALLPDLEVVASTVIVAAEPSVPLVVAGAGLARFHRPDCRLARDKSWSPSQREVALAAGQLPCGVCHP